MIKLSREFLNRMDGYLDHMGMRYDIKVDGYRPLAGYWSVNNAHKFAELACQANEVDFAKYKAAYDRKNEAIAALEKVIAAQREVIDLLHAQIGRMEQQVEELKIAVRTAP